DREARAVDVPDSARALVRARERGLEALEVAQQRKREREEIVREARRRRRLEVRVVGRDRVDVLRRLVDERTRAREERCRERELTIADGDPVRDRRGLA